MLQQMLRDETTPHDLMCRVLQLLQQFRPSYHPILLLDKPKNLPQIVHVDLCAAGLVELRRRIEVFGDDCDTPGLNVLRIPQLGKPSPAFADAPAGQLLQLPDLAAMNLSC